MQSWRRIWSSSIQSTQALPASAVASLGRCQQVPAGAREVVRQPVQVSLSLSRLELADASRMAIGPR